MLPDWAFAGCPEPPPFSLDFDAIVRRRRAVLAPMAACLQDPVWHAEGDVLTHTRMVCERLVASDGCTTWPSRS